MELGYEMPINGSGQLSFYSGCGITGRAIVRIFIPFLLTCMSSGTIVCLSGRKFEEVLPLAIMADALVIFLSGFLSNLKIGYIVCVLFALCFPVLLMISAFKKDKKHILANYLTPGFLLFCVLFVFLFLLNVGRQFTVWDEFMHWGPMAKEMFRLDKYYSAAESVIPVHRDYPPIVPILQVFWCKLAGLYREDFLYISLQTLEFSMFFPALSGLEFKKSSAFWGKLVLVFLFIVSSVLLITLAEAKFYSTIYIDSCLAITFAYGLYLSVCEKKVTVFNLIRLGVCLSFLLLTKQIGLPFFLLILSAFALNYAAANYSDIKSGIIRQRVKKRFLKTAVAALCIAVIPCLFSFSWNAYISASGIERQFNISDIRLSSLAGIFSGTAGEAWQHTALINYIRFIFKNPLIDFPVKLTYWQLVLVCTALLLLAGMYAKKHIGGKSTAVLNTVVILGSGGYAFTMLLLYTFCFGCYEGQILACADRYLDTYIFAAFILAAMLFLLAVSSQEETDVRKSRVHLCVILILMWAVWIPARSIAELVPNMLRGSPYRDSLPLDAREISEKTPADASVYIISQGNLFYCTYYVTNYEIMPRTCNSELYSLGEPYSGEDSVTKNIPIEAWKEMLSEWDYLFLQHVDEQFITKYGAAFAKDAAIESGQLYKINKTDGKLSSLERLK